MAEFASRLRVALTRTNKVLSIVGGVALLFIMLSMTANIVRRELLDGRSFTAVIEYNEIVLTALVFLSLANTQRTRDHVAVDLLTRRLPERARYLVRGVGLLVAAAFLSWMAWRSGVVALDAYRTGEYRFGLARVAIWPARMLLPFGLVFLVLQILVHAADDLIGVVKGRRPAAADTDSAAVGL